MTKSQIIDQKARILEIGPYPPPMAGWSIRIRFVKERLEAMGHVCLVLNLGRTRKIPSASYITVRNGPDYVVKVLWYAARGYTMHMHTNGDGVIGFILTLIAALSGFILRHRIVLSFHAGTHQRYFPRERSRLYRPIIYLIFKLPKLIICNNEAVKNKITEYGISPNKITPIRAFGTDYVARRDAQLPHEVEQFVANREPIIFTYAFLRDGFYWDTLVEGMQLLIRTHPNVGLVVAGSTDDHEPPVRARILNEIRERGLIEHIHFAGDLSHDQFLTLMRRSKLYLRTPTSDGECSSVLESLTCGIPVVAAENHSRPTSVLTYPAKDSEIMCQRVNEVLSNSLHYAAQVEAPVADDTVATTARALINAALGSVGALQSID